MKQIPTKLRLLTDAFINQYPVNLQPPFTTLSSGDLDKFGMAQGLQSYLTAASDSDLNVARSTLAGRLNRAGEAPSYWVNDVGFQIVPQPPLLPGQQTLWIVKPLDVAAAHRAEAMPKRNVKTIANRVLKTEKLFDGVNLKLNTPEEKKLLKDVRTSVVRMAQLEIDIANVENKIVEKAINMLRRKDPVNKLLPK